MKLRKVRGGSTQLQIYYVGLREHEKELYLLGNYGACVNALEAALSTSKIELSSVSILYNSHATVNCAEEWLREVAAERRYKFEWFEALDVTECFNCGDVGVIFPQCRGCGEAIYCSRACQAAHWTGKPGCPGHAEICCGGKLLSLPPVVSDSPFLANNASEASVCEGCACGGAGAGAPPHTCLMERSSARGDDGSQAAAAKVSAAVSLGLAALTQSPPQRVQS